MMFLDSVTLSGQVSQFLTYFDETEMLYTKHYFLLKLLEVQKTQDISSIFLLLSQFLISSRL